jgi:DNA-binding transcriptional LysR family regulator
MTPGRLENFLAVVEGGSARAAAQRLSVTESAVSASLAALRREVGVVLFERHGRGLALTEAGRVFAGYARRILGLIDEGVAAARQGERADRGLVRLGTVATAGEYLVPGLLASFRRRYPQVEVTLDVSVRDQVFTLLADHRLDVVIAGRPLPGHDLVSRATRANRLIVVTAAGSRSASTAAGSRSASTAAGSRSASTAAQVPDLATVTWLLREAGSGTRDTTLALLDSLQIEPPTLSLGSHGAVVASAALGLGVTVVSADAVTGHLERGELAQIPTPGTPLDRPWHAVTGAAPAATARLFLEHLIDRDQAGQLAFTAHSSVPAG